MSSREGWTGRGADEWRWRGGLRSGGRGAWHGAAPRTRFGPPGYHPGGLDNGLGHGRKDDPALRHDRPGPTTPLPGALQEGARNEHREAEIGGKRPPSPLDLNAPCKRAASREDTGIDNASSIPGELQVEWLSSSSSNDDNASIVHSLVRERTWEERFEMPDDFGDWSSDFVMECSESDLREVRSVLSNCARLA